MRHTKFYIAYLLILLLWGCSPHHRQPQLGYLYNRAASYHDEKRNPVILIPGILGSELVDSLSGRVVWGEFSGNYANPNSPEGARLFALPMERGTPLEKLHDSVQARDILDRVKVKILGLPIQVGAYYRILDALGVGGYIDESRGLESINYGEDHFTCFQFPYDWRLDNVENARKLHQFILEKRAYVQREYQKRYGYADYDVHFDIVAHSMGGLIARYYLRYGDRDLPQDGSRPEVTWAGSRYVSRVVLVGPPNAGSLDALQNLVEGRKLGPLLPRYQPALVGTLPSLYQLLPRGRHGALVRSDHPDQKIADLLDLKLWESMHWGLADPAQEKELAKLLPEVNHPAQRRQIALDHLQKCLNRARQFTAALDLPATPPPGLQISLIAGDASLTPAVAAVDPQDGSIKIIRREPGDGTVLRSSALMDERLAGQWQPQLRSPVHWSNVLFLFSEHLAITQDPIFTDNLLYLLLEHPRR